jgi:hypothetical protein
MAESNRHGLLLDGFTGKLFGEPDTQWFDGAEILNHVSAFIRRYVHLSDQQARIAAVWVAHTHAVTAATTTPYLSINSAVKQSGKTRLLEVLELLVNRPWLTGRLTAACLVRKVDQVSPTLLLDESDAAFQGEQEYAAALRGILNTGFYLGGTASACVGQGANISFKDFRTYCAKAIAGIGTLPDTIADRSVPIRLQRKKPGETVARFRRRHAQGEAGAIKTELSDWITSIMDTLKEAEPSLPESLTDRQQDGMEPLFAIADAAGGDWPEAVRTAAAEIFRSTAAEDQNIGVLLLADINLIFESTTEDKITTADLLEKLKEIETSPWADWGKGKGLTPNGISRLLKPFGVSPRTVRTEDKRAKGYLAESFEDAFARYLPRVASRSDLAAVTPCQPAYSLIETDFSTRDTKADVTDRKSASGPHKTSVVTHVTDRNSPRAGVDTKERTLPSCPACGSYALYRLPEGGVECQTCGDKSSQ